MAFQGDSIFWVEVEKVVPNPFQPRREFDQAKLKELADSIRMYGILQPLTVTRRERTRDDGTFYNEYELIAGERRLRASKLAGLAQVPVIIRDGEQTEQEKLELAIIENLQREDLNAIDRAQAFQQLHEQFKLTHKQIATKMGRSREYVANSIRLLLLPDHIQSALRQGDLSEGHARTLLMLSDKPEEQDVIFREILLKKITVRETERLARKIATDKVRKQKMDDIPPELLDLERKITERLGTRVQIKKTDFGGTLSIDYFDPSDLDKIIERLEANAAAIKTEQYFSDEKKRESEIEALGKLESDTPLQMAESEVAASTEETRESSDEERNTDFDHSIEGVDREPSPVPALDTLVTPPATEANDPVVPPALDDLVTPPTTTQQINSEMPTDNVAPGEGEAISQQEVEKKDEDDDSDIYSIKNFGI